MGRGGNGGETASGKSTKRRRSKNQKRLDIIIKAIPRAREQLLAAIEDLGPEFTVRAIQDAAESSDPRERNKVALLERQLQALIDWLDELAARSLAEGQRLDVVSKGVGRPWERLADLGVISKESARRLQNVKEIRDEVVHVYPLIAWRMLHRSVERLLEDLNDYLVRVVAWLRETAILPDE